MPTPEELWQRYRVTGHLLLVRVTPDPAKPATIDVRVAHPDFDPAKPATYVDLHLLVAAEDVPLVRGRRGERVEFVMQSLARGAEPAAGGLLGLATCPAADSQAVPHANRLLRRDLSLVGCQTCQDPFTYRIHFGSGIHCFVDIVTADGPAATPVKNAIRIEEGDLWEFKLSVPFRAIFLESLRRWSQRPGEELR